MELHNLLLELPIDYWLDLCKAFQSFDHFILETHSRIHIHTDTQITANLERRALAKKDN